MNRIVEIFRRRSRGGVNRLIVILLALIAVMLVIIAIPKWEEVRYRSEKTACVQALKSARDGLIIDYFDNWQAGSVEDARETLDAVLPMRPGICPSGGTVYLIRDENGIFEPFCGLHADDTKRRTRLNASRALDLFTEALKEARKRSEEEPESVTVELNSRELEVVRVLEVPNIHRGTATTNGYKGVVAFYGLAGEGEFSDVKAKAGTPCFFLYADEDHCATWRLNDGWTGEAYM